MDKYVESFDKTKIHYKIIGNGKVSLIFVHGWLGNIEWWKNQENFFKHKYQIISIDLAGHGKSDKTRKIWTSEQYSNDIKAVIHDLNTSEIILIGHSMAGAYVLEASKNESKVKAIILIDTLKDLDQVFTYEQAEQFLFNNYRADFKNAVENILPPFLFVEKTPQSIKSQLQNEFLQNNSELAVNTIEPLYKIDIREIAKSIEIPVRAINSDATPTNIINNQKYLKNYNYRVIYDTGHYPMLEKPNEFNIILNQVIDQLIS